MHNTDNIY